MSNELLLLIASISGFVALTVAMNAQCGPNANERRSLRARLGEWLFGWHPMWAVRLERRNIYPLCRIIPLHEAAEIAREQTFDTRAARMAKEICSGDKVSSLAYYAAVLGDADWMDLYGCRRNCRRLERIDRAEFKETQIVDDGQALKRYWDAEPIFTKVHICRRDLYRRIRELNAAEQR